MDENQGDSTSKKTWSTPDLKTHGTVEGLTQGDLKLKIVGTADDFCVPRISDTL